MAHCLDVVETNNALALDFDAVHCRGSRGGAADVEGAHGELRAGFADRLRRDDTHRLTDIDPVTACEVATVTLRANAVAGLTGYRGTHFDLVDAHVLELLNPVFVEQGTRLGHDRVLTRRGNVFGNHASEHSLTKRFHNVTALDERRHHQTVVGAAIQLRDDEILGPRRQAAVSGNRSWRS